MAYPGSRSHLWVPGERVDDTVLNEWAPKNVAWGYPVAPLAGATPVVGPIGNAQTDITGVSLVVPVLTGRWYEVFAAGVVKWSTSPVAADYGYFHIATAANAVLGSGSGGVPVEQYIRGETGGATTSFQSVQARGAFKGSTYGTGNLTIKARLVTAGANTGRLTTAGSWSIIVMDVGPEAI